jgi:hemerythrin-like metal-binding protein
MTAAKAIDWDARYEIGIARIDFEHRIFADLINDLAQRITEQKDRLAITRTLREVMKYADFHFLSEENLMEESGYPGFRTHKELHRELQRMLNDKAIALAAGHDSPAELLKFLVDWFLDHTAQEDRRIALYCCPP